MSGLFVGSKVEGNYKGKGRWYTGQITVVRNDGTFDIVYDDGESEQNVSKDMVREFGNIANLSGLEIGAKVEVNYKGSGQYYPGVISKINGAKISFSIDYDDGETEDGVDINMIRILGKSNLPKSPSLVSSSSREVGARVEANYRGKGTVHCTILQWRYEIFSHKDIA